MQSTTYPVTVQGTLYRTDRGDVIGAVYAITTYGGRTTYVAESHDWDGDHGGQYIPLSLGVFADDASAADAIERRARGAQAPDTL